MNLPLTLELQFIGCAIVAGLVFITIGLFSAWVRNLENWLEERRVNRWRAKRRRDAAEAEYTTTDYQPQFKYIDNPSFEENITAWKATHDAGAGRGELLRRMSRRERAEKFMDELEKPK